MFSAYVLANFLAFLTVMREVLKKGGWGEPRVENRKDCSVHQILQLFIYSVCNC